ncbi:hypothetical protein FQA39_LY15848 [Lamprigera yunnana]|nr:hypothetical protein FQA39_LY15848 [Lamprigera yunnana]
MLGDPKAFLEMKGNKNKEKTCKVDDDLSLSEFEIEVVLCNDGSKKLIEEKYLINPRDVRLFGAELKDNLLYNKLTEKFRPSSNKDCMSALMNKTILEHNSVFLLFDVLYDVIQKHNPKFNFIIDSSLLGEEKRIFSTKPGTHFSDNINNIVTILLESGIMDIKRKEYKRYLTNFSYCFHNKPDDAEEPVVLSLVHVYPVFVYWGFGLIVATVVFMGELVVNIVIMKFKEY